MSRPDYALGSTIYVRFTSRNFSTGAPYTLAGTPTVDTYENVTTTQIQTGISVTADFDAVTGLNVVTITASSGNGYSVGNDYAVVISAGTVNSVSVVGEVVFEFSIEKQSALRPTTAGRTLDVSSTGEAGLDWANVGSPTTSVNLSGTTIATSQAVASVSGAVGSVTGAVGSVTGNVGGNVTGSVGSISGITFPTNFSDLAITVTTGEVTFGNTSIGSVTGAVGSVTGAVGSVTGAVGSVTGNVGGNITGTVGGIAGTTTTLDALSTHGDSAWATATGFSTHSAADIWSVATRVLTAGTNLNDISVSDVLTTQMTEAYAAAGVAPTLAQAIFAIQQMLAEVSIASTTLTTKKLDGSTTAMTFTLDSSTAPTSKTRAT